MQVFAISLYPLRAAVEWSLRYLPDFRLPDKALDLVDQAGAAVRFRTFTPEVAGGGTRQLLAGGAGGDCGGGGGAVWHSGWHADGG